ncbi:MAG TPA: L-seryl-tRNA(Sec) selenium transferase [Longimicrobiales bacterium]
MSDPRRDIPSVDRLLASDAVAPLLREWPRTVVVQAIQDELSRMRTTLEEGGAPPSSTERIAERVHDVLTELTRGSLRPAINATGVILHTNLGRAPLAAPALEAILSVARGYSNLEYDTATGSRGSRYVHCRALLRTLTGAEDALVVNNNAAALVLALNTLARGCEAVVSRGELVEIGGAFRVPEIMARSGAVLREVGTTNRTHLEDYAAAIGDRTGALLKVHPSNFTIQGYTAEVSLRELASLAEGAHVPLIHDIGSGLLLDPELAGLPPDEPTPRAALSQGASVVTMSGDKLLGGPQCGIILGTADHVDRMRRNPLCRALRVDKLTLAALSATLRLQLDPERALREIPVLRMLTTRTAELEPRAEALVRACDGMGLDARIVGGVSAVGGGAAPAAAIPTVLVTLARSGVSALELERRLRTGTPTVVARIVDDRVAIDLRTVDPEEEPLLLRALEAAAA